jgi:hypothetical protein
LACGFQNKERATKLSKFVIFTTFDNMILQLDPMIPIFSIEHNMEGYAFLVIDYSQEHDLLFTCALDNGEIWTINNKDLRFCWNRSLDRVKK